MKNILLSLICVSLSIYATTLNALANPASQFCADSGGKLRIETRGDGGQYGVCDLGDNRLCEEWALLRGNCPIEGLKVTGYTSPQQVYCVITGGSLSEDQGECLMLSGSICKLEALWMGQCDVIGVIKEPALEDITN